MQTNTLDGALLLNWNELDLTSAGTTATQMVSTAFQLTGGALTNVGTIATFTYTGALPANIVQGTMVAVTGMSDANWNGYFQIAVPVQTQTTANLPAASTIFTYQMPGVPANATGTPVVSTLKVRTALIQAVAANAGNITFGPTSAGTARTLIPGQEYVLPQMQVNQGAPTRFDLALWYWVTANSGDKLKILWLSIAFMLFFLSGNAWAQLGDGGYSPYPASAYSQGLLTNVNKAGWTNALGIGGGGGAPSGPAGNALTGTYPNPGVASFVAVTNPSSTQTFYGPQSFNTGIFEIGDPVTSGANAEQNLFINFLGDAHASTNIGADALLIVRGWGITDYGITLPWITANNHGGTPVLTNASGTVLYLSDYFGISWVLISDTNKTGEANQAGEYAFVDNVAGQGIPFNLVSGNLQEGAETGGGGANQHALVTYDFRGATNATLPMGLHLPRLIPFVYSVTNATNVDIAFFDPVHCEADFSSNLMTWNERVTNRMTVGFQVGNSSVDNTHGLDVNTNASFNDGQAIGMVWAFDAGQTHRLGFMTQPGQYAKLVHASGSPLNFSRSGTSDLLGATAASQIITDDLVIDSAGNVIVTNASSTFVARGLSSFVGGYNCTLTNWGNITATGYTNSNAFAVEGYWTATTGVSVTNIDTGGNAWRTNASLTSETVYFTLASGAKIMAPSGLTGNWHAKQ